MHTGPAPARRTPSSIARRAGGGESVEALVIIAIVTILVTRAYLQATGYPQIGGGTLHIAHALWGGAGMVIALVVSLSLLGTGPRTFSVVLGGIGFGLFLDEVGKFVTKTNDYFYSPAVSIMYVVVVVILVLNRLVLDVAGQSGSAALAGAAGIAADGMLSGLTPTQRTRAQKLLTASRDGAPAADVAGIEAIIASCPVRPPSRRDRIALWLKAHPWVDLGGSRATVIAAVVLTLFSFAGVISALVTISDDLDAGSQTGITPVGQLVGSAVAAVLCLVAVLRLRDGTVAPVRLLRAAALVTMLLTEVFDFVEEEFGALINVAIGLLALAVFTSRIRRLQNPVVSDDAPDADDERGALPTTEVHA
ncbi:hypothetical protein [Gordonia sp. NB41Y]|uniref:hypothetical protein n=1 Tax=Gordonia sp. NB41Y TaxID=875808 RepID=UPI0002BE3318|nr:hypothetical protein [Gordonia sp. NB41Y]WLP90767.1 hypothetical protein Q9K23_00210 [Gordonia sp. NB41Y]